MRNSRFIALVIVSIASSFLSLTLKAQKDVMLTQHWVMPTLLNPAATGDIDFIRIRGGARLDYLGLHASPKNFLGTVDAPFKVMGKRVGAGVMVNSESYDLYRNLHIGAQGSYKFNIKKSRLSIGLQIGYYHSKFKGSEYILSKPDDETGDDTPGDVTPDEGIQTFADSDLNPDYDIDPDPEPGYGGGAYGDDDMPTQDVKAGTFDISIGIRYEHPFFYVGLAGLHLTNPTLKLTTEGESTTDSRYLEYKMPMSLYFDAGGNIPIPNSLFTLQPSVQVATDFSDFNSVIEMRATYNQRVTFGVDYRWNRAVGVMAGISIKNFFLGYSWEYDYTEAAKKSTGNHELILGYQFKLDMGGKNQFSHRSIRIM